MARSTIDVSMVNHRVRTILRINADEYCMLWFIYEWRKKNPKVNPKANDISRHIGYTFEEAKQLVLKLQKKELLTHPREHPSKLIFTTDIFNRQVDTEGLFDDLWKLHPKGNKKTARSRLEKVVPKMINGDQLKSKLMKYINNGSEFKYLKGLDVWLNPDKEHWNDPIIQNYSKPASKKPASYKTQMRT